MLSMAAAHCLSNFSPGLYLMHHCSGYRTCSYKYLKQLGPTTLPTCEDGILKRRSGKIVVTGARKLHIVRQNFKKVKTLSSEQTSSTYVSSDAHIKLHYALKFNSRMHTLLSPSRFWANTGASHTKQAEIFLSAALFFFLKT